MINQLTAKKSLISGKVGLGRKLQIKLMRLPQVCLLWVPSWMITSRLSAAIVRRSIGCVPVPMYQDAAAEEMAYALENCVGRIAVVSDQEQVDKIADIHA